jgi:uncharacterized membrane protein
VPSESTARRVRLPSIDVLRGAVMVLMALDHVRVYAGVPAGGPSPGLFFTRWVTHFCAPVFVFLAGTSAFLHGRRLGDTTALARFLVVRGLVLVLLELTVIRLSWTFGVDYSTLVLAGVIWMIGWCMVLLAGLVWLPPPAVGVLGLAVIVVQDLFRPLGRALPAAWQPLWELVYPIGADVTLGTAGPAVAVLYTLVPWIGVMAAGYGFGTVLAGDEGRRRRRCLAIGLGATVVFLAIALVGALRQPEDGPLLLRVLNQRKYPASVPFLLMTLGPAIALLPAAERARRGFAGALVTIGRVPLFYYLLHIPLIHAVALVVWHLRQVGIDDGAFATAPFVQISEPQRWPLSLLYAVFAGVVVVLYVACRWFDGVKARSAHRWLRYL